MISSRLAAAGIPGDLPAAERAAAVVRGFALRLQTSRAQRDLATAIDSGWLAGPSECHRLLNEVYRGSPGRGSAFGVAWPYLEAAGRLVAPALPVALGHGEAIGPDGCYRLADGVVWREAVGERQPYLRLAGAGPASLTGFELLWYGGSERYLVNDGLLEVEDLFSVVRLPASSAVVDRLLIRARRVDAEVLEGVRLSERSSPAEVEVRRPVELLPVERWRDPLALLGARADVRSVERQGEQVVASIEPYGRVVFNLVEEARGWRLYTWEGSFRYRMVAVALRGKVVQLAATLTPDLDPLAPGVRGRLAFDLKSTLVALAEG